MYTPSHMPAWVPPLCVLGSPLGYRSGWPGMQHPDLPLRLLCPLDRALPLATSFVGPTGVHAAYPMPHRPYYPPTPRHPTSSPPHSPGPTTWRAPAGRLSWVLYGRFRSRSRSAPTTRRRARWPPHAGTGVAPRTAWWRRCITAGTPTPWRQSQVGSGEHARLSGLEHRTCCWCNVVQGGHLHDQPVCVAMHTFPGPQPHEPHHVGPVGPGRRARLPWLLCSAVLSDCLCSGLRGVPP